ncbi:MAG: fasciclin domain-containing protein [Saprospiraceae bacterium]|nr:fasciclin domain-containing protein [Saprospiraceae bacterium]
MKQMCLWSSMMLITISLMVVSCTNTSSNDVTSSGSDAGDVQKTGQAFIEADDGSVKNILQIAVGSADHSTLVAAVQATDLENVLANNGPLTVFAPTNAAFDKLPDGTLDDLLKPENKKTLANIIWYHAAPGTYNTDRLTDGLSLYQATGDDVAVTRAGDDVLINGNKILGSVPASNGVVHVVDGVLLPPE